MSNNIGIAIAALFSALSFMMEIFKLGREKIKTNIEYVTNKRVDWIYSVRQEASEFAALALRLCIDRDTNPESEDIQILENKRYLLGLFLNYNGVVDSEIIENIESIVDCVSKQKYELARSKLDIFIIHMRLYLKIEWDRVNLKRQVKNIVKKSTSTL